MARYTNRVAIGNQRIVKVADGQVTFRYKDAKTGQYNREMTLAVIGFIRRFMQHILPSGFYKIRYFGILASVNSPGKKNRRTSRYASPFSSGLDRHPIKRLIDALSTWSCSGTMS